METLWNICHVIFSHLETYKILRTLFLLFSAAIFVSLVVLGKPEAALWIVFMVFFSVVAFHHWTLTKMSIKSVQHHLSGGMNLPMSNIPQLSPEARAQILSVKDTNDFIGKFISINFQVNRSLTLTDLAAMGTCLLSCVVALRK